jgi:hypothetical protein
VLVTAGGVLLGLLVGLRHAFEPDHLAAVSTLVTETQDPWRGVLLGALWGIGHTLALLVVGVLLLGLDTVLPADVAVALEVAVVLMLVGLGARALARALGGQGGGAHRPRPRDPAGAGVVAGRGPRTWPLLAAGLIHGMAGSGALTALVFAELPTDGARVAYIVLFGAGSIAGMAAVSGVAGVSLRAFARTGGGARAVGLGAGCLSLGLGIALGVPLLAGVL